MKIAVLDFESYYASDYSLSKMPTSSYVRDPRFQVIGLSMSVDGVRRPWFSGTHAEVAAHLGPQSWWDDAVLVAHNAAFDASILTLRFGLRPALLCCTMSMARALGMDYAAGGSLKGVADTLRQYVDPTIPHKGDEVIRALGKRREDFTPEELAAYGAYCDTDVELCERLFHIMVHQLPTGELQWQDTVMRMATEPALVLDAALLAEEAVRVRERKAAMMQQLVDAVGAGTEDKLQELLGSNPKFAQVLQAIGIEPPTKISKTTGKTTYAFAKTDAGMQDLLEHPDPMVQLIASVRLSTKSTIEETRVEHFVRLAREGALALPYKISGAHTHRLSGSDGINVQNLPSGRLPGQSNAMRRSIAAPDGYAVVAGDSSQVEARVLAYCAGQQDLLDVFANKGDPYKMMATRIYSVPMDEVTKGQRQIGKSAVLGCLGGMTKVLTNRGWVFITDVTLEDLVWDGKNWVRHRGLLSQGVKETITAYGLTATSDHEVLTERGWVEWHEVLQNPSRMLQATSLANLPCCAGFGHAGSLLPKSRMGTSPGYGAAAGGRGSSSEPTCAAGKQKGATPAPKRKPLLLCGRSKVSRLFARILSTVSACSTGCLQYSTAATNPTIPHGPTMAAGGSRCGNPGTPTNTPFLRIWSALRGGIKKSLNLTASTTSAGTSPATSGSAQRLRTPRTSDASECGTWRPCGGTSAPLKQKLPTYDLAYAGPNNRFTVLTAAGPLIVHNCGYGLGANKFKDYVRTTTGIVLEPDECKRVIDTYRQANHRIVAFWKRCDDVLRSMIMGASGYFGGPQDNLFFYDGSRILMGQKIPGIRGPDGMWLNYPELRLEQEDKVNAAGQVVGTKQAVVYTKAQGRSKQRRNTWGGTLTENLVQYLAFALMKYQAGLIKRRYPVKLNTHDEHGVVAPVAEAHGAVEFVTQCMSTVPPWLAGCPIGCDVSTAVRYGDC